MKYRFMNEHRDQYSLVLMCRVLKVARAGFYQWLHKPLSDRAIDDQRLVSVIRHSYAASGGQGVYSAICGKLGKLAVRIVSSVLCAFTRSKQSGATRRRAQLQEDRPSSRRIDSIGNLLLLSLIKSG